MKKDQDNQLIIVDPDSGNMIEAGANSEDQQMMHHFLDAAKGPMVQLAGIAAQFAVLWLIGKFSRQ